MTGMTPHEKECAFAALALRLEKAKTGAERKELREWLAEIKAAPIVREVAADSSRAD